MRDLISFSVRPDYEPNPNEDSSEGSSPAKGSSVSKATRTVPCALEWPNVNTRSYRHRDILNPGFAAEDGFKTQARHLGNGPSHRDRTSASCGPRDFYLARAGTFPPGQSSRAKMAVTMISGSFFDGPHVQNVVVVSVLGL